MTRKPAAPRRGSVGARDAPASRISRLEGKKRPLAFGAVAFIALAIVIVCLEGLSRQYAYDSTLEDAEVTTANLARASAEHAQKTVELVDAILFSIVERVESDGLDPLMQPRLRRLFATWVGNTPALHGLYIDDEQGKPVIASGERPLRAQAMSERAYFDYHQAHVELAIHLDRPIRTSAAGDWVVPMSRRLQHPDGSFAGVVLATVPIQYFQDYYDGFDLGQTGVVLLAMADGTLITRRPFTPGAIGQDISTGAVFSLMRQFGERGSGLRVATLDQVERLYSYRRLTPLPLVVAAALSKRDIFASWWAQTYRECAAVLLLIGMLSFVGDRLFRQVLIREVMERQVRRMHTRLEESITELDRLARTDALTGLSNRRSLGERVDLELARANREKESLALIMIDIDFFKRYNDTYGHVAGDACLKLVSATIGAATRRPGDMAARYGGEEFAVLLPNTGGDGGMAVARRVCAAVAALQEAHQASEAGIVTISAGVYACCPDASVNAAALFARADQALYAAKTAGRNQAMALPAALLL